MLADALQLDAPEFQEHVHARQHPWIRMSTSPTPHAHAILSFWDACHDTNWQGSFGLVEDDLKRRCQRLLLRLCQCTKGRGRG